MSATTTATTSSLSNRPSSSIPAIHLPRRHSLIDDSVTTVTPSVYSNQIQPTEYQVVAESCDWCIPVQWGGADDDDDDDDDGEQEDSNSIIPSSEDVNKNENITGTAEENVQDVTKQLSHNKNHKNRRLLSRKKCPSKVQTKQLEFTRLDHSIQIGIDH